MRRSPDEYWTPIQTWSCPHVQYRHSGLAAALAVAEYEACRPATEHEHTSKFRMGETDHSLQCDLVQGTLREYSGKVLEGRCYVDFPPRLVAHSTLNLTSTHLHPRLLLQNKAIANAFILTSHAMHQVKMPNEPDIPLDSPLRTFPKRNLPQSLASTYPHGHISGHARSPQAQRAFEARKNTILRTMNAEQIEAAYLETTNRINAILDEDRKRNEEIDREVENLTAQRELERKLFWRQKEEKAGKVRGGAAGEVKEEKEI